mmetsp:Transcript_11675/g.13573  ORF Transcript_11675/g.13573 Transcript_11675/m.13573 type:complete len:193 (+) Transcript_11675:1767-2345(+)
MIMRNLLQILILALSIRSIVSFLPLVTSTRKSLTLIHTTPKCQSSTYPLSCIHKNQRLSYYLQRSLSLSKATVSLGVTTASTSIEADIDANGDLSKMLQEKIYSIKKYENDDNKPNQKNIDDDDDDNQESYDWIPDRDKARMVREARWKPAAADPPVLTGERWTRMITVNLKTPRIKVENRKGLFTQMKKKN